MTLPRRILFVGAHCDDIELFAGGLMARLAGDPHAEIGVITFSDHRGVVDETRAQASREEHAANLAVLRSLAGARVADHSSLTLAACRGEFEERRGEIYAALEGLRDRYEWVVTHAATDTNQDHAQVAVEARRVFKAHATVLAGEFPYDDVGGFTPSLFVRLDDAHVDLKRRLCARYESQRINGRPYFDGAAVEGLLRARGAQVRAPAAEAFAVLARVIV